MAQRPRTPGERVPTWTLHVLCSVPVGTLSVNTCRNVGLSGGQKLTKCTCGQVGWMQRLL